MRGTPYAMMREVLWSSNRIPCSPPPWGILTAVDLNSGTVKWSVPHGQVPWLADRAEARSWGSPNLGGAIVTAGGRSEERRVGKRGELGGGRRQERQIATTR